LSLWRVLNYDENPDVAFRQWKLPLCEGVFDALGFVFSGGATRLPEANLVKEFFLALFAPFISFYQILEKKRTATEADGSLGPMIMLVAFTLSFLGFFVFMILIAVDDQYSAIAFFCYFVFASVLGSSRSFHREKYQIEGSMVEDYLVAAICYPQVLVQLKLQSADDPPPRLSYKVSEQNKELSVNEHQDPEAMKEPSANKANIGML